MRTLEPVIRPLDPHAPHFNLATHDGKFHADEIMAIAILTPLFQGMAVYRTRSTEILKTMDLCVDIGGGPFDHHQKGHQHYRGNGMPLASAGLVWAAYGERYVAKLLKDCCIKLSEQAIREIALDVDRLLVEPVDAQDCGVVHPGRHCLNYVGSFNSSWLRGDETNDFQQAVHLACLIFRKEVMAIIARAAARDVVVDQLRQLPEGERILILEKFVPWIDTVQKMDPEERVQLVVFQDMTGTWRVQTIPKTGEERFVNRLTLPEAWRGVTQAELALLTGVEDAMFCHPSGFIAGAATREGVVAMAYQALLANC